MSLWAQPRHPWFATDMRKRKLDSYIDSSSSLYSDPSSSSQTGTSSQTVLAPDVKRRKIRSLEDGLATMSIRPEAAANTGAYDRKPIVTEPTATEFLKPVMPAGPSVADMDYDDFMQEDSFLVPSHVLPTSVEEPDSPPSLCASSPEAPEVSMKTQSWYEPEKDRIVITELDDSDNESEGASSPTGDIEISPALLECMKNGSVSSRLAISSSPDNSRALVLFRPIRPLPTLIKQNDDQLSSHPPPPAAPPTNISPKLAAITEPTVPDDDAMDIE